jgi:hypothetical protein
MESAAPEIDFPESDFLVVFGMSPRSFRSPPRNSSLRGWSFPAAGLLAALILAGCGGSASAKVTTVTGEGFRFHAPTGWTVAKTGRTVSAQDGVGLMQVTVFTLEKPYRVAEFAAVTRELDTRAQQLAQLQPGGRLVSSNTMEIAGRKVRSYRIDFSHGRTEEIAFVLRGQTEYFLLCRRQTSASAASCTQLFDTFALG